MWELIKSGGWLMFPIIICSIATLVIVIERMVRLNQSKLFPKDLRKTMTAKFFNQGSLTRNELENIKQDSPLGDVLATGLLYRQFGLDSMTMHMENRASVQVHGLEKNINFLGTIGAIAPLLGLLGTVLGIIMSFLAITQGDMRDPTLLAAGVSKALITTAAGMFVAIPALVAYRYFQRRIVDINAGLEREAGLLLQELYDHNLMVAKKKKQASQVSNQNVNNSSTVNTKININ